MKVIDLKFKDIYQQRHTESQGTKEKFWIPGSALPDKRDENTLYLVKFSRNNLATTGNIVGDHYSEYIASKICEVLEIPHAEYEICKVHGKESPSPLAVLSENLVRNNEGETLKIGNEFLEELNGEKIEDSNYRQVVNKIHTLDNVLSIIAEFFLPKNYPGPFEDFNACDLFCGYLLLDVLISNQDRHCENWAAIAKEDKYYLCPTYDHAASLGCTLLDINKKERLTTKDKGRSLQRFVEKGVSALKTKQDTEYLKIIDAFLEAVNHKKVNPKTQNYWIDQLGKLDDNAIENIINPITDQDVMSEDSRNFAIAVIKENRDRLLKTVRCRGVTHE